MLDERRDAADFLNWTRGRSVVSRITSAGFFSGGVSKLLDDERESAPPDGAHVNEPADTRTW